MLKWIVLATGATVLVWMYPYIHPKPKPTLIDEIAKQLAEATLKRKPQPKVEFKIVRDPNSQWCHANPNDTLCH